MAHGARFLLLSLILLYSTGAAQQPGLRIHDTMRLRPLEPSKMVVAEPSTPSQASQKLDPLLRITLNQLERGSGSLAKDGASGPRGLTVVDATASGTFEMPLFLRSSNVTATQAAVEAMGGSVSTIAGDILVARVPVHSVRDLAITPDLMAVEGSTLSRPMMNVSRAEVKADLVHAGTGLSQSYTGQGVVAGILDSGIDWRHEDFKTVAGSRIYSLWDMSDTTGTNVPAGYTYGREYSKAQIDAGQCFERDGNGGGGHGTHVSGTVAGNGRSTAGYSGMAPEANIVFVKGIRDHDSQGGFSSTDVVDGCNYIFTKAQALGMPAAINLSLGGHYGPHDGSSNYEQALSNLTGPGKIIVAAAGNEAGMPIHLRYTTGGTSLSDVRQTFWGIYPAQASVSVVDLWYDSGSINFGVAAYDGQLNLLAYTNPVAPGQVIQDVLLQDSQGTPLGYVTIDASTTSDPNNGARRVVLVIDSNNNQIDLSAVNFTLYTYGTGTFDAWVVTGGFFTLDSDAGNLIYPGDNVRCMGMPATSQKLIAVGSYVTKTQWVDIDGVLRTQGGNPTIGDISSFSNRGPSRDGRIKPDIAAPGEAIVSALSSDLTIGVGVERTSILQGGMYQKMQGTSMASPHVAGAVALMLQANATLITDSVRQILQETGRRDATTGATVNNTFGGGRLDAYEAVKRAAGGGGTTPSTVTVRNYNPGLAQQVWTLDSTFPLDSGFVFGTNHYQDKAKATILSLPQGISQAQLTEIKVWFGYKRAGLTSQAYQLNFYGGNATSGPSGAPFASRQFLLANVSADDNLQTTESPTVHTITPAVQVSSDFFVSVDFGSYALAEAGMAALASTPALGQRVAEEWEMWSDNSWHNISDAWFTGGGNGGSLWIEATLQTGVSSAENADGALPRDFALGQNYPNPFNPETAFEITLPSSALTTITVYDMLGRHVATLLARELDAGTHIIRWNAGTEASGIYFYRMEAGNYVSTKKMILMR